MAVSYWEWLNRGNDLPCCLALCLCPVLKVSARLLQYLAQNNVLIKRDSRWREIYEVLAARMRKFITARARKNKRTAHMLANARKDHLIPLLTQMQAKQLRTSKTTRPVLKESIVGF